MTLRSNIRRSSSVVAAVAACAALAGCGGGTDDQPTQQPAPHEAGQHEQAGQHESMNMGDPTLPRADTIEGANLRTGELKLLPTRPPGLDGAKGTAFLATHQGGTTVTVEMTGLKPGSKYKSHLHAKPCSQENGGGHFQFDPNGAETPPNEVHLVFTADAQGKAMTTANNDRPADAKSLVVHPAEFSDNRVACADF
ncbi:hypothetical protein [Saccharopolyspora griseoalba]|uniref:Superoxide dismutase n=1 Tax=Saccharopolyspora griseoalba TaxID=1431848 RepID=A0ABW2LJL1_9PSEU